MGKVVHACVGGGRGSAHMRGGGLVRMHRWVRHIELWVWGMYVHAIVHVCAILACKDKNVRHHSVKLFSAENLSFFLVRIRSETSLLL